MANILADLAEVLANGCVETPPDGWRKVVDWQVEYGRSISHTERLLRLALKAGKVERKAFRTRVSDGRVMPIPHYRVTP